jgi:hypothetical protein
MPNIHHIERKGVSEMNTKYEVVDRHTGKVMGTYSTLRRALHRVDRLDNEYGGYRYFHRAVK